MNNERFQTPTSETLFIPLAVRALETKRSNPVLRDEKAAEILEQAEMPDTVADGGGMAAHGILSRTKVIDEEINGILLNRPDTVIINLGAGLDTRISRIDNGRLKCFELDLPDVIALRRKYFAENERIRFIAKSVLDDTWARELREISGDNTVIIAEGLLMYFAADDVKRIFQTLTERFHGALMYFDVVHSFFVGKGISSTFLWGLDKASDIEAMNPNIRLVRSWSTGDLLKERQSPFFRIMNVLPSTRNRSQIICVRL